MHEIELKLREICDMKEKLISWSKEEFGKGKEHIDAKELSDVVDMIKDFAEAEKDTYKAQYYKIMACLLMEGAEDEEDGPMGYDNWRYASGRFAPTGRGHFAGYPRKQVGPMTTPDMPAMGMDSMGYVEGMNGMRGYSGQGSRSGGSSGGSSSSRDGSSSSSGGSSSRYGYPYDEWNNARRYYTESGSEHDKKQMDHKALEHVTNAVESVEHIWREADPQLKEKLKKELKPLMEKIEHSGQPVKPQ